MVTTYKNGILSHFTPTGVQIAFIDFNNLTAYEIETYCSSYAEDYYNQPF